MHKAGVKVEYSPSFSNVAAYSLSPQLSEGLLPKSFYLQCLRGYEDHLVILIFCFCDVDVEF